MASVQPGAAYMAGGIDFVNRMKAGFSPGDVIHLGRIAELTSIGVSESGLHLGACATHQQVGEHTLVRSRAPALAHCWRDLGNPRVRCKGTIGGNVMAREPQYDATLMLMAAGATLTVVAHGSTTVGVPLSEAATVVDGLVTSIAIREAQRLKLSIDRSLRPALCLVMGFVQEGAYIDRVRIAIGGAYAQPYVRALDLADPISRTELKACSSDLARAFAQRVPRPLDDWQASSAYRSRMIGVLLQRLLLQEGCAAC